jgi:outer membrane protein OmpA-like peptidoglycan-associated protein
VKKQTGVTEEKGERAPLWIISFADMISLLMAFFVMLLTMAMARSGKLCNEGEKFEETLYGFRRQIAGFGVPGLFGKADERLYFDSPKAYYPISDGNEPGVTRTIDASEEKIRRIFHRLNRRAKTYKSQMQGREPDFIVAPITFGKGQFALDESAKQFLIRFTADLQKSGTDQKRNLYVVGLAPQESGEKQQWVLSVKRAQAVANFLQDLLPAESGWSVYSWGAGSGGDWVSKDSPISDQLQILITVLRNGY